MKKILWILGYMMSFVLGISLLGFLGITKSLNWILAPAPVAIASNVLPQAVAPYDDSKPTVAILLGNTPTEPTDFLGPYAMYSESGEYNVYAVASSRTRRTLAGGLDVVPQLSFEELGTLIPRGPEIIVVPAMANVQSIENVAVLDWLKREARRQSLLFAWCEGAEVLAAAGLLDGRNVTTHWASIDKYEQEYPAAHWKRGERYVDSGNVWTTAGLTSGIDATLRFLQQRNGTAVAARVARALHLPTSPYVSTPHMQQYSRELSDGIFLLNFAFDWPKTQTGVWLYDGIGELDLAAVIDVYQATDQIHTVAGSQSIISSHGLQFVPRWNLQTLPTMHRILVPSGNGAARIAKNVPYELGREAVPVTLLEDGEAPTFPFRTALEDLAKEHDIPSAAFAAKRLEVRSNLKLSGSNWPLWPMMMLLFAGLVVVFAFLLVSRLFALAKGYLRRSVEARSIDAWQLGSSRN